MRAAILILAFAFLGTLTAPQADGFFGRHRHKARHHGHHYRHHGHRCRGHRCHHAGHRGHHKPAPDQTKHHN